MINEMEDVLRGVFPRYVPAGAALTEKLRDICRETQGNNRNLRLSEAALEHLYPRCPRELLAARLSKWLPNEETKEENPEDPEGTEPAHRAGPTPYIAAAQGMISRLVRLQKYSNS